MRSSRTVLAAAGLLIVVGLVLWFVLPGEGQAAYIGVGTGGAGGVPWLLLMTTNRAIGVALVWVGSLLAAGVVGHRVAVRLRPPS